MKAEDEAAHPAAVGHSPEDVTRLLRAIEDGDPTALDRLLPLIYEELRSMASGQLARERGARTLNATGLVHEAYLKLAAGREIRATDRCHFLAVAARAMRQVLIEHARRRKADRRGGGWARTTLTDGVERVELDLIEILALNAALEELDPRQQRVVEYRFFGGMTEVEVAQALGITVQTVRRDWVKARAWLYRSLYAHSPSAKTS